MRPSPRSLPTPRTSFPSPSPPAAPPSSRSSSSASAPDFSAPSPSRTIRQVITEVTGDPLARLRNSFDGIVATANTAAQSASRRQNRNHRRCRHSALVPRPGRLRLGRTPRRHRPVRPRRCRRITRHHRPDRLRVDQGQSPPPRRRHRCQRLLHRRKGRRRTRYRSLRHRRRGRRFPR